MTMIDWRGLASCRNRDPEVFYPIGDVWTVEQTGRAEVAKRICADCPVRWECLNDAIKRGDTWAILGGLTPAERREISAVIAVA